ncbi:hypothetical protein R8Z50_30300 [Longispora sp. K20-0274]|uniref:hypothetical protein n=1 Tax=Longispora sp. K20-0274 TaxID=3088255 RepID=UPI003999903D
MDTPNERLREARLRLVSPSGSGRVLSRPELADLINTYVHDYLSRTVEIDENYIGKLERGQIRWPSADYRTAFRAVLKADTDAEIGFFNTRRTRDTVGDVNRGAFLRGALAVGAGALVGVGEILPSAATVPVPERVGKAEIEFIRRASATFTTWDNAYGGDQARALVLNHLNWCSKLLTAKVADQDRPDLFSAVSSLAAVAGFMAFDALAHSDARRILEWALACAEESGDWHLRAKTLSSMARQEIWCGQADQGLTYIEMALVRADRLTATERAMLSTVRARALAKWGRARQQDTLTAVGLADEQFTETRPDLDPASISFYDDPQHHGDTAHALFDLELVGRPTDAAQRLQYAIAHHTSAFPRSKMFSQIKLSGLLMVTGDPREAAAVGHEAVDGAGTLRSPRSCRDLRDLLAHSQQHAGIPAVADLRRRVFELAA